jgi:hypothetical protein
MNPNTHSRRRPRSPNGRFAGKPQGLPEIGPLATPAVRSGVARRNDQDEPGRLKLPIRPSSSAPETEASEELASDSVKDKNSAAFLAKKRLALIRSESAFLYKTLGDPGGNIFESFQRIARLAEKERGLEARLSLSHDG